MRNRIIRRLVYGGDSRFREHERVCLDAAAQALSSEARDVISRQVAAVDTIQRFADNKITVMHLKPLEATDLLRDVRPELRIAKVRMGAQGREKVTVTLVTDHGRISSLEFNRPPEALRALPVQVEGVDVLVDPMASGGSDPDRSTLRGPRVIAGLGLVREVLPPCEPDELLRYLAGLGTATPRDYAELLAGADGFIVGEWQFLGTRARLLKTDVAYIIAAERVDGTEALCFEEGAAQARVILYDEIDDDVRAEYGSFIGALKAVVDSDSDAGPGQ